MCLTWKSYKVTFIEYQTKKNYLDVEWNPTPTLISDLCVLQSRSTGDNHKLV